eukprot:3904259-Amphidinium_carterae.1
MSIQSCHRSVCNDSPCDTDIGVPRQTFVGAVFTTLGRLAGFEVMGGYGYVGEYKVERLWRDAKLLEIGGGTNEVRLCQWEEDTQM